ncbi:MULTISPECIES: DeoR/GlpR family DNA-binding transcription regulator [Flavobacteriaceae]|uniref:DeoR/GlpR family DNA-binding transcription regulator n=1 Tax=Flavobacteriaceae TaxID=49546 RepID=UPI001490CB96|nr:MULTISPECIES: DeoR/GlpR family DNA-binding transcription regulator [Allomuricauda]MDC6367557.1 DeoR/GlpR family DNA-binding transcription regulator [Muricauda sp. AC10]
MLKEERHQVILNEVRIHNKVLLTDIAEILKVSPDTVRRDIKELHDKNKLKRVHGGAISLGFNHYNYANSEIYSLEKKSKIAEKAVSLLKAGQVVLLTGGTTNQEIARLIPPYLKITCFTPSLPIAVQLLPKPNIEIIFIGGKVNKDSQITIGGGPIGVLSELKVDICFLGVNSMHPTDGITEFDWEIVQLKKAMIRASKKVVVPSISEKINSVQRYKICEIDSVHVLITELEKDDAQLDLYRRKIELM